MTIRPYQPIFLSRLNQKKSEVKHQWSNICTKVSSAESDLPALHQVEKDLNSFSTRLIAEMNELKDTVKHTDIADLAQLESLSFQIFQEWEGYIKSTNAYKDETQQQIHLHLQDKLEGLKRILSNINVSLDKTPSFNLLDQAKEIQVILVEIVAIVQLKPNEFSFQICKKSLDGLQMDFDEFREICGNFGALSLFDIQLSELNSLIHKAKEQAELQKLRVLEKEQQIAEFQAKLKEAKQEVKDLGQTNMELSSISEESIPQVEVRLSKNLNYIIILNYQFLGEN